MEYHLKLHSLKKNEFYIISYIIKNININIDYKLKIMSLELKLKQNQTVSMDILRERAKKNCDVENKKNKYIAYFLNEPLSDIQKKAVIYVMKKSKAFSKNTKDTVKLKFIKKGWDINLIPDIVNHIACCDAIIHFKITNLYQYFKNDAKYRNLFEIYKNSGSALKPRNEWENNLFSNIYNDALPEERVKYGCINLYGKNYGCKSALIYGESYIILKSNVKKRCSFVCGDSSGMQPHLANFEHLYQLLLYINDSTILNLIKLVKGEKIDDDNYPYVEIQIHGDVMWNRDIEKLMINKQAIEHNKNEIMDSIKNIPYELF